MPLDTNIQSVTLKDYRSDDPTDYGDVFTFESHEPLIAPGEFPPRLLASPECFPTPGLFNIAVPDEPTLIVQDHGFDIFHTVPQVLNVTRLRKIF